MMGCGLEKSSGTSGPVGRHKDPLVAVRPSLPAPGTFDCHALLLNVPFFCRSLILCVRLEPIVTFVPVSKSAQVSHAVDAFFAPDRPLRTLASPTSTIEAERRVDKDPRVRSDGRCRCSAAD